MIPYLIVFVTAFVTQKHFWKSWSICSVLLTIYSVIASVYLACVIEGVPFSLEYFKELNWSGMGWVVLEVTVKSLGIFASARFFCWITGQAYWKPA
jgi:hypothetical protein